MQLAYVRVALSLDALHKRQALLPSAGAHDWFIKHHVVDQSGAPRVPERLLLPDCLAQAKQACLTYAQSVGSRSTSSANGEILGSGRTFFWLPRLYSQAITSTLQRAG